MEDEAPPSLALKPPPPPDALLPKKEIPVSAIVLIGLGMLLLVAVLVKLFRRRNNPDPTATRRLAYEAALRSFQDAKADNGREAATLTSLVLRRYLATVSGDPALFETHVEFISRHDSLKSLPEAPRQAAVEGFDRLAALKYAKEPGHSEPAPVFESGRTLLETLNRAFA